MSNDERIEIIKYATRFVNKEAIYALTDITRNTYIIKASTGQGVTTALLNYPYGNYIVLSPNVGMIEGKEKTVNGIRITYKSEVQFFKYYHSDDSWNDVVQYLDTTQISEQNMIINTTPDQILKLWRTRPELYDRIIQIPIFVDELHAYFEESTLREVMGATLELIYNEWQACFTLSTATPTHDFLDIPTDKDVKSYKLIRENDPVKHLQYTEDSKLLEEFVYDQINEGRPVLIFTNDLTIHKKFKDPELRVANLVGDKLRPKLEPYKRGNLGSQIDPKDYDIIILSSKYFAGYDIEMDCSVCIVSNQYNEALKINVQNLVQSYGRCRGIIHKALYINSTSTFDRNNEAIHIPRRIQEVDKAVSIYETELSTKQALVDNASAYHQVAHLNGITQAMYVNRSKLFTQVRDKINDYHQYNKQVLIDTLEGYNFQLTDYVSTNMEKRNHESTKLNQRLLNLLEKPEWEIRRDYPKIKYDIRHLQKGAFNSKLAFEFLTAWILKKCDSQVLFDILHNKAFSVKDFYRSLNLFLRANVDTKYYYHKLNDNEYKNAHRLYFTEEIQELLGDETQLTNDWQMLYMIHQINSRSIPQWIKHEMVKHIEAYDLSVYEKFKSSTNRVRDAINAIVSELEDLSTYLSTQELEWLREVVKDVFGELDKGEEPYPVTHVSLKKKMTDYLIFLLTDGNGNHKSKIRKNREYNAMVNLPKHFRRITPLILVDIDLVSAISQLLNSILEVNNGLSVYSELGKAKNQSRDKSKTSFNSTVNNHELKIRTAKAFYQICGYSPNKALELAQMTAQVPKGSFYEMMTKKEKRVIENYQSALGIRSHRFHDGLVMSQESVDKNHIKIPTCMDGFIYHVTIFNDGSQYLGPTTDVPHDSKYSIDNYEFLKLMSR